jgi:hypothetical protein
VVRTTVTNTEQRVSYYAPAPQAAPVSAVPAPVFNPIFSAPAFGGFSGFGGGRSC